MQGVLLHQINTAMSRIVDGFTHGIPCQKPGELRIIPGEYFIFKYNWNEIKIERKINIKEKSAEHIVLRLPKTLQNRGIGTINLHHLITEFYPSLGVEKITVIAAKENGAYTWARCGFVPDQQSWDQLRRELQLTPLMSTTLGAILKSHDPRSIRDILELPNGRSILVESQGWFGVFDLADPETLNYFRKYANSKRK